MAPPWLLGDFVFLYYLIIAIQYHASTVSLHGKVCWKIETQKSVGSAIIVSWIQEEEDTSLLLKWYMRRHGLSMIWTSFPKSMLQVPELKSNPQNYWVNNHATLYTIIIFRLYVYKIRITPCNISMQASTMTDRTSTQFDTSIRPLPTVTFNKDEVSKKISNALESELPKFLCSTKPVYIATSIPKLGLNIRVENWSFKLHVMNHLGKNWARPQKFI